MHYTFYIVGEKREFRMNVNKNLVPKDNGTIQVEYGQNIGLNFMYVTKHVFHTEFKSASLPEV